ncbi:MAG: ATP-binding cassette domain-containing protein [Ghiorsea sp.]|nr:ATP-binding cassette domain-containing protein [Ghiorsea sp.]
MSHINIQTKLGALNLQVQASFASEIIIISGENGAGKTSLLRCIAGLQDCAGSILVNEKLWLNSAAGFELATGKRKLGFVWAEEVLLPWLDVAHNIQLGIAQEDKVWLRQVCEQLEISHLLKRTPAMLSTGEAQRVSLARAIYGKPSMLLLDEPFSAQAPDIRARLRQVLKAMQQTLAIPLLMISHDTEDAKALAGQHWRMREGKLLLNANKSSRPMVHIP